MASGWRTEPEEKICSEVMVLLFETKPKSLEPLLERYLTRIDSLTHVTCDGWHVGSVGSESFTHRFISLPRLDLVHWNQRLALPEWGAEGKTDCSNELPLRSVLLLSFPVLLRRLWWLFSSFT